jgi:hypothetical protein
MLPMFKDLWKEIETGLVPALEHMWDSIKRLWQSLNPALMDALKIVGGLLFGLFMGALFAAAELINGFAFVIDNVISVIATLVGWISNLIGWFGNLVGAGWNAV